MSTRPIPSGRRVPAARQLGALGAAVVAVAMMWSPPAVTAVPQHLR